jgi:hypothetical protein
MEAEDVGQGLKILEVALIASVKFLLAPFEAERWGFNFGQSFAMTTTGGLVGIFVFYYAGSKISTWWRHLMALLKSIFTRRPASVIERKPPKRFTRTKRFIVRVKKRFGLAGIAFITPSLISIPIGSIVAAQLFPKKKGVLLGLAISLVLWSLFLNGLAQYLELSQYIPHPKE